MRPLAEYYIVKDNVIDAKILAIRCKCQPLNEYLWNLHVSTLIHKFRFPKENMISNEEIMRWDSLRSLGWNIHYLEEEVKERGYELWDLYESQGL
ncbi:Protein of unknown function [Cotesia congregata]|uniref:Uncharacterized protein n=1 Tax=Cotesia congregata TaxID=51543 RepID=A0A8J2MHI8_COTCN|nr:Protein of unknown function [Cotesia congregata]